MHCLCPACFQQKQCLLSNQSQLQITIYWSSLSCPCCLSLTDPSLTSWMFQTPSTTRCTNLHNQTKMWNKTQVLFPDLNLLFLFFPLSVSSFDTNQVHFTGTSGLNQPGQQGQHIYTEYQSLGPNNGLHGPFSGPREGQRPTLREPLIYIPVAGPDGNRVPLVKVCKT